MLAKDDRCALLRLSSTTIRLNIFFDPVRSCTGRQVAGVLFAFPPSSEGIRLTPPRIVTRRICLRSPPVPLPPRHRRSARSSL